jgi:predicted RNase H-like nuclease (RuvC/YqgF family)
MKTNKTLLEKVLERLNMGIRQTLADEGEGEGNTPSQPDGGGQDPAPNTPPPAQPNIDFESLIAKARKEEKEKLYPEITKLKEEVEKKVARINELLLAIGEKDEIISQKDKEIKELKNNSKKSDSQEVKELNIKIAELENKLAEKDREINTIKLTSYRDKKIAEAGGELIPELVTGNSEEEIDLSIEKAKER